jgi:hypothetical protein
MNVSTDSKDTIKFWTFLTMMLLGVAIAVTLIDLTIKAAILSESNALKLRMEAWGVENGQTPTGRIDQRNTANGHFEPSLPADLLGADTTGLEAPDASNGTKNPSSARARDRRKPDTQDGN